MCYLYKYYIKMSDPACVISFQASQPTQQTQLNEEPEVDYTEGPQNDPYKMLPKSTMNLSQCKNDYFVDRAKYFENTFWTIFDSTGFSVHRGFYKYNYEFGPLPFIRRNVVTGIVQSMDSTIAHKNLFGVFKLFTNKHLECIFVTRGDTMLKECSGDMIESFDWNKLDTSDVNVRKDISDFFAKEEDDNIEFYTRFV